MELTEQQKLEILCAYLPYGVDVIATDNLNNGQIEKVIGISHNEVITNYNCIIIDEFQPILRHPDDMTEEELKHLANNWGMEFGESILADETPMYLSHAIDCLRYLHSIHIDTFGAIEAGWAIRKETK